MATAPQKTEAKAEAKAPAQDLVKVNAKAMQVGIGPEVIGLLDRALNEETKAHEMLDGVKTKRYDAISKFVLGILHAANNDKAIDLSAAFSGDKNRMNKLNNQIGIALGYRELQETADGENTVQRVVVAK